jgi:hypothetical protein
LTAAPGKVFTMIFLLVERCNLAGFIIFIIESPRIAIVFPVVYCVLGLGLGLGLGDVGF